jgi:hypothetical protein
VLLTTFGALETRLPDNSVAPKKGFSPPAHGSVDAADEMEQLEDIDD